MKLLATLLTLLLFLITYIASNTLSTKKTLYIYMWSDYIRPDIIERFQKEHDCWVIVDCYDSNEAMYTKLLLGASGYDIVFPSNYFLDLMARRGMLLEINPYQLENSRYIDRSFLEDKLSLPPSRYGIPYMMTFSGIAWRNDRIDPKPLSWNLFSSKKLNGRLTLLNDMRETVGISLKSLGYSANSLSPDEIQKAKEHIITSWRPNIAKFESEQYKNGIANGEYIAVHGFSGDCLQVMNGNPAVSFAYPKEGSLVAVDYGAIMASSKAPDLALEFLNFLLDPVVTSQNMQFTCSRAPNTEARNYLPPHFKNSPVLYPEDNPELTFECIQPVDSVQGVYNAAWDDIKAGRL